MQIKETQPWIAGAENDADKGAAFGALLGALHECWDRCRKGPEPAALATMRPEGVVTAQKGHRRIIWLAGRLHGILSSCRMKAPHVHDVDLERPDVEGLVVVLGHYYQLRQRPAFSITESQLQQLRR